MTIPSDFILHKVNKSFPKVLHYSFKTPEQWAYQQQRRVDVDVLEHNELFLHFDGEQPWTVQFSFHPVPHTAVLPLKRSGQSPDRPEDIQV